MTEEMREVVDVLVSRWEHYVQYLRDKYPPEPGEGFKFTCPHHRAMHESILLLRAEMGNLEQELEQAADDWIERMDLE